MDRTGVFSNNLIVVTGGSDTEGGEVWQVDAATNAVRLANLTSTATPHLEGVVTLPDDLLRWGPWAGRIITGSELIAQAFP